MAGLEKESARFRAVTIQVDYDSMNYNTKKLYNFNRTDHLLNHI